MQAMTEMTSIQILVMHHDPLVSAGINAALSQHADFEVRLGAPSRDRALPDDIVIADYEAGLELIADAKRDPRAMHQGLPRVLIVTRCESEWEIRNALERGARGYLLQGCGFDELIAGVRALHRGARHLSAEAIHRIADSLSREALTTRETEVLRLIAEGLCNKVISSRLNIAVGTVKTHVKAILGKLDAGCRTEAAAVADRRGLLRGDTRSSAAVAQH